MEKRFTPLGVPIIMKETYRRSKRISKLRLMPQLFAIVGAILVISVLSAPETSARSGLLQPKVDIKLSNVEKNELKLKELDKAFQIQQEKLKNALKTVEQVKKEAEEVAAKKESIEEQVASNKAAVDELERKVQEKKRIEAEEAALAAARIMRISTYAPNSAGNGYTPGQCTYYVKNRRPDIGNNWGNANAWYHSAQAQGFKTGSIAKVGAIGVSYEGWAGHVVYVESVNGEMVTISEMNYGGPWQMNTRTVHQSSFVYIYERA